ncbi:MAG: DUF2177 family protein [Desulfosalsimonas sp.]|uniref:DUF2177 family protein n=1 Tax=Desulfosalsimonas sp. TaxID=3073848 RepID=UPI003970A78C
MSYFFSAAFFKVAGIAIVIFIVADMLWLAVIARDIYFRQMSHLASVEKGRIVFNLPVGILAQVIIALGLAVFVSLAIMVENRLAAAVCTGAFAGFALYCTYDLTNLSFVKNYPVFITVVDIAWGTAQGLFAGFYVFYLTRFFGPDF